MQPFIDRFPNTSGPAQFAPAFPDYIEDVVLSASTSINVPLPAGARFAVFSFDADVRARLGLETGSLTWPSTTSNSGAGGELNPAVRRIPVSLNGGAAATHICLVSQTGCTGSVSFYA